MSGWILFLALLGAYWLSLHLHPYRRCRTCSGAGFHQAGLFSYASRGCHACGGRGVHQRLGAALLGIGYPSQRGSRFH